MKRGQIDLFTKRVRAPPAPLERGLHIAIADLLRVGVTPGWVWFHCPNGGERVAFLNKHGRRVSPEGGLLKRMGTRPGVADLLLLGGGRAHALELKRRGERPNEDQVIFANEWMMAGGLYGWADSFDGAEELLRSWGALRTGLTVAK